jgi:hypothetical protein
MVSHGGFLQGSRLQIQGLDAVARNFDTLKRQSHQTFNEIVLIMTLSMSALLFQVVSILSVDRIDTGKTIFASSSPPLRAILETHDPGSDQSRTSAGVGSGG